jgi:hypothetical protein
MRTEDVEAATAATVRALRANPAEWPLALQLAKSLQYAGRTEAAYDVLIGALARSPGVPDLEITSSIVAAELKETVAALRHAEAGYAMAPDSMVAAVVVCDAQLGLGRPGPAARIAEALHQAQPNEQQVLARLATAWRLMDDPRYRQLYDYDAVVRGWMIDAPPGWADLPAYLAELGPALRAANKTTAHPYDQSLRQGSQTHTDLALSEDPVIKAFFTAIDAPIRSHMDWIGQG